MAQLLAAGPCEGDKLTAAFPCALLVCVSTRARPAQLDVGSGVNVPANLKQKNRKSRNYTRTRLLQHIHRPPNMPRRSALQQQLFVFTKYTYLC